MNQRKKQLNTNYKESFLYFILAKCLTVFEKHIFLCSINSGEFIHLR